eukprot:scaffold46273_cov20-Tisochrysis_lutea.AAC.6
MHVRCACTGKDLLPNHLLPGYMGPEVPMSGLKGLSGIRLKEDDEQDSRAVRRVGDWCGTAAAARAGVVLERAEGTRGHASGQVETVEHLSREALRRSKGPLDKALWTSVQPFPYPTLVTVQYILWVGGTWTYNITTY